ncbi:MAG: hypothetical protein ACJ8M1_14780 [Chthoniobacterales bacterium]
MTGPRFALQVAGVLFGVFSAAHIVRLIANVDVRIAGRRIPMWPSVIAAVLAAALAIWFYILTKGSG